MDRIKINYLLTILLLISFVLVAITGILKLPELRGIIHLQNQSSPITSIHDLSGILLVFFTLFHIYFYRKSIIIMTKKYLFKK